MTSFQYFLAVLLALDSFALWTFIIWSLSRR